MNLETATREQLMDEPAELRAKLAAASEGGRGGTPGVSRGTELEFQQLADHITDAFWIRSADMQQVHYLSPAFEQIWGRTRESLYANPQQWPDFILPEDRQRVLAVFAALTETSPNIEIEYRIVRPDGEIRWVRVRGFQVRDATDHLIRHAGIVTDITERRRVEQELKEVKIVAAIRDGEERYSFLAAAVPLIIWTAQPDGIPDYYNKAWFDYTGLRPAETGSWKWSDVLHPDDRARAIDRWAQSLATGEKYELEYRFKRGSDGTYRWHLGRAQPMRDEQGRIVQWVGTCTDIDDGKRSKETLQAANEELEIRVLERTRELHEAKETAESANRAKSEFLANMSHEIRTPMNGIIGMTELVLDTKLDREQREYLGMAQSSAHALLCLINQILDFSKIEAGKLELEAIGFSLRECIGTLLKPLALRAAQKGIELGAEIPAELPDDFIGDPMRLRQILINLTDNAIKFTRRGTVCLRVMTESATDAALLHFTVSDTGAGIEPAKQEVIFEAFAQADGSTTRTYGGTGLGLPIASQLVEQMGGRIWVESAVGIGTTFHFTVLLAVHENPKAGPRSAPSRNDLQTEPQETPSGLRILLAEDNTINSALAAGILKRRGHIVTLAWNGREAVEAAAREAFDLIFMDVQMPEMDGFEATRRIRESELATGARTPIAAMTAHAMAGDRERCLAAGMDDYISKPLDKAELLALIQRSLRADKPG